MTAYNPDPIYAGDTWPGIPAISILIGGSPPAAAVARARLVFFRAGQDPGSTPATGFQLTSPDGVGIINASTWSMTIPPAILLLDRGDWSLQFKTTDADGIIKTWFAGTLTIL